MSRDFSLRQSVAFWTLAAVSFAVVLAALYSQTRSVDDYAFMAVAEQGNNPHSAYRGAYRFVPYLMGLLIHDLGYTYHDFMPLWVLVFAAGTVSIGAALVLYIGLPRVFIPFAIAAFASHGYLTDIYGFPISYNAYGLSWLSSAAALLAMHRLRSLSGTILGGVLIGMTLMTYQPAAHIPLFAAALSYINRWLKGDETAFGYGFRPVSAFLIGCCIVVAIVSVWGSDAPRSASLANIATNLWPYLFTTFDVFYMGGAIRNVFPYSQSIIYGFGLLALALVVLWKAAARRDRYAILAVAAFTLAVAISPGIFNLITAPYYPSLRSMSGTIAFQLGSLLVLANLLPIPRMWIAAFAVVFVAVCSHSLLKAWSAAMEQRAIDERVASLILSDIEASAPITAESKIAVRSTWNNVAQNRGYFYKDTSLSGFTPAWASARFLWLQSPLKYQMVPAPDGSCEQETRSWYLEQRASVTVVCMN